MKTLVQAPECPCDNDMVAVVVNAANVAKARCLECGEEGEAVQIEGPKDWLT